MHPDTGVSSKAMSIMKKRKGERKESYAIYMYKVRSLV